MGRELFSAPCSQTLVREGVCLWGGRQCPAADCPGFTVWMGQGRAKACRTPSWFRDPGKSAQASVTEVVKKKGLCRLAGAMPGRWAAFKGAEGRDCPCVPRCLQHTHSGGIRSGRQRHCHHYHPMFWFSRLVVFQFKPVLTGILFLFKTIWLDSQYCMECWKHKPWKWI